MKLIFRYRILTWAVVLTAYGLLVWQYFLFLEIDSCVDAGGIFDTATSNCIGYRPDEFGPLSNRPMAFWVFVAITSVFPIAVVAFLFRQRVTTLEK